MSFDLVFKNLKSHLHCIVMDLTVLLFNCILCFCLVCLLSCSLLFSEAKFAFMLFRRHMCIFVFYLLWKNQKKKPKI